MLIADKIKSITIIDSRINPTHKGFHAYNTAYNSYSEYIF
jgi:hypothetical protein